MEFVKGRRLSAETMRQIADRSAGGARLRISGGDGRSADGPLGSSVAISPLSLPDDNVYPLKCAHTLPIFSLVEVEEALGGMADWLGRCGLIQRSGASRVGITLAPSTPDAVIPVQVQGICVCRYSWDVDDDLEAGDRLLGLKHDVLAHKCDGGPLLVLAVGEHDEEWEDWNYALVNIVRKRLDNQRAKDCYTEPLCNGVFEVIVVGVEYAVTGIEPGVVLIGIAPTTTTPTTTTPGTTTPAPTTTPGTTTPGTTTPGTTTPPASTTTTPGTTTPATTTPVSTTTTPGTTTPATTTPATTTPASTTTTPGSTTTPEPCPSDCTECPEWHHVDEDWYTCDPPFPPCDPSPSAHCNDGQKVGGETGCVWAGGALDVWCATGFWWVDTLLKFCNTTTCQEENVWVLYYKSITACPAGSYTKAGGEDVRAPGSVTLLTGACT